MTTSPFIYTSSSAVESTDTSATTSSSYTFPVPFSDGGSLPSWFNADLSSYSGTVNAFSSPTSSDASNSQKFYNMVNYMYANPMNTTAALECFTFLSALSEAGLLGDLNDQVNIMGLTDSSGTPLVDDMTSLVVMMYVQEGVLDGSITISSSGTIDISPLVSTIDSMFPGNDPVSDAIKQTAASWELTLDTPNNAWTANLQTEIADGYTLSQFSAMDSLYWGTCIDGGNTQTWSGAARSTMMSEVSSEYPEDPLLAMIIWLFMINDQDTQNQIEGYGATSDWLTTQTTSINDIMSTYEAGDFTATSAAAFMEQCYEFQFAIDNSPVSGSIQGTVDDEMNSFFNTSVTFTNSSGTSETATLGSLYQSGDDTDLALALNATEASSTSTSGVPTQYTEILDDFQAVASAITDQSTSISTDMSQLTTYDETIESSMNNTFNGTSGVAAMNTTIVGNQITS